jgi:regulator of replication initiation timing
LSALRIERATLVEENADLRAKLGEQVAFNTQVDRLHDRVARLVAERDALRAALKRLVDIAGEIDEDEHLDVYKTLTLRERVKEARAALTPKKED